MRATSNLRVVLRDGYSVRPHPPLGRVDLANGDERGGCVYDADAFLAALDPGATKPTQFVSSFQPGIKGGGLSEALSHNQRRVS